MKSVTAIAAFIARFRTLSNFAEITDTPSTDSPGPSQPDIYDTPPETDFNGSEVDDRFD